MCYQTMVSTLRNAGYKNNTIYLPDDSSLNNDFESWLNFFGSENLVDPEFVAKYATDCFSTCIDFTKRLQSYLMDTVELAVLFQIFALKRGKDRR